MASTFGVGMLFAVKSRRDGTRRHMLASIAPVWDGNETWLVLNAMILFAIFPLTYSALLSAFYLPLLVMLAALIFRGVAFEFREKSLRSRPLWDAGFAAGSFVATFIQGVAVGALVQGLPFAEMRYVGGPLGWLSPFALSCGGGLCLGYALLGAGWLTFKTAADAQALAFRVLPWLFVGVVMFLVLAFTTVMTFDLQVKRHWAERPFLLAFPLSESSPAWSWFARSHRVENAFRSSAALAIFVAAAGMLAGSFYPYMIPFSIRVADAVAPHESVAFLFWGAGVFVLPITLVYTVVVYFVFKGKVVVEDDY